jgi:hypothetical protein
MCLVDGPAYPGASTYIMLVSGLAFSDDRPINSANALCGAVPDLCGVKWASPALDKWLASLHLCALSRKPRRLS